MHGHGGIDPLPLSCRPNHFVTADRARTGRLNHNGRGDAVFRHHTEGKAMKKQSNESLGAMRDHAGQLLQSVIEQATSKAMAEGRRVEKAASNHRGPFGRSRNPSVRDIALNAASGAIELWQAARDKAEEGLGSVQGTVVDSAQGITHGAHEIGSAAVGRVHDVGSVVTDKAKRAEESTKAVAVGTAREGRHGFGLVFWTGAAGAIAYYAFLDEERRTKARTIAMRVIDEARSLLSDFQGADG